MNKTEMPEGWTPSNESIAYIEMMSKNLKPTVRFGIPGKKEYEALIAKGLTKEQALIEMQSPSIKNMLTQTKEEREKLYAYRDTPEYFEAIKGDHKAHGDWSMDDILHAESIRHSSKNSFGQSESNGSSPERKELSRQAFTSTPPAPVTEVQEERVTRIEKITELTKVEKLKEPGWLDKILSYLSQEKENQSFAQKYPDNELVQIHKEKK